MVVVCLDAVMAQSRGRSVTAVVLMVVGTLLLPVGIIGHWTYRTFTNNEQYVATVAPLTQSPEVQSAIAETLSDSLITSDEAAAQVKEWFPKAPDGLVNTVSQAVVTAVGAVSEKLVASPQFSQLWAEANSDAQKAAIALLTNQPPPSLSVQDGNLVLNLDVLRANVRAQLQTKGINLPQVQAGKVPATVVLMQNTQIQTIRSYYSWAAPLLQWFIALPILLLILSFLLRPDKARGMRWMAYGVLIGAGIVAIFLLTGDNLLTPNFEGTPFAQAQSVIWNTLTVYLSRAAWITAGIGLVLLIAGVLWGWRRRKNATPEVVETIEVVEV